MGDDDESTIAVIPARGGSRAIPKKNIVDVLGKPLITYTIQQAKGSSEVDTVCVSTDADDIAAVSEDAGAIVIDRPPELADDKASTESALLHALDWLREQDTAPDVMVLLQCTSPLRRANDINDAIRLVTEDGYDSALSVCTDHAFYWKQERGAGKPVNYTPKARQRRQDLPTRYRENGSIYVFRTGILEEERCRLGGRIGLHQMPRPYSFEIDTPADRLIVEAVGKAVDFFKKDA